MMGLISPAVLPQQVRIDAWLALRNDDRAHRIAVKLKGSRRADNSVNITELAQTPAQFAYFFRQRLASERRSLSATPVGTKFSLRVHS